MLEGLNRNVYQRRECLLGQVFSVVMNCAWRFSIPFLLGLANFSSFSGRAQFIRVFFSAAGKELSLVFLFAARVGT